jgi:hypothetical protein
MDCMSKPNRDTRGRLLRLIVTTLIAGAATLSSCLSGNKGVEYTSDKQRNTTQETQQSTGDDGVATTVNISGDVGIFACLALAILGWSYASRDRGNLGTAVGRMVEAIEFGETREDIKRIVRERNTKTAKDAAERIINSQVRRLKK